MWQGLVASVAVAIAQALGPLAFHGLVEALDLAVPARCVGRRDDLADLAVGDVFDALISARPYKHAWPIDEALAELERQAGVLLDPDLVAALLRMRDDLPRLIAPGEGEYEL